LLEICAARSKIIKQYGSEIHLDPSLR